MNLIIEEKTQSGLSVIKLRGKLMLSEGKPLESVISKQLADGHTTLVFDLSDLTHIDSTGIGQFIDTYGRLKKEGGSMRLAGASGPVRESFHVTRLDTVFSFYPSVEAACQEN